MEQRQHTVLLIDDDPFFLKVMSGAFRDNGFSVCTADDGIAGIKAYLEHTPEVVIVDLIMPRMGGVSTCLEITRVAGDRDPVLVLLTSMFKEPPHEHRTPEMGASVHISKNTKPLDIVIIVEQLLDRKRYRSADR